LFVQTCHACLHPAAHVHFVGLQLAPVWCVFLIGGDVLLHCFRPPGNAATAWACLVRHNPPGRRSTPQRGFGAGDVRQGCVLVVVGHPCVWSRGSLYAANAVLHLFWQQLLSLQVLLAQCDCSCAVFLNECFGMDTPVYGVSILRNVLQLLAYIRGPQLDFKSCVTFLPGTCSCNGTNQHMCIRACMAVV
jgi:hypothetical protein